MTLLQTVFYFQVMIFEMEQPRNPQVLMFRDSPILSLNSHR